MVALLYLLCVMAPTIALALPDNAPTPDCLVGEVTPAPHVHGNDDPHAHHHGNMHEHEDTHVRAAKNAVVAVAPDRDVPPAHKPTGGSCCELMCLTALPAALVDVTRPPVPPSRYDAEPGCVVADNAPTRHYRPPIFPS
jgi:hypothetical protein